MFNRGKTGPSRAELQHVRRRALQKLKIEKGICFSNVEGVVCVEERYPEKDRDCVALSRDFAPTLEALPARCTASLFNPSSTCVERITYDLHRSVPDCTEFTVTVSSCDDTLSNSSLLGCAKQALYDFAHPADSTSTAEIAIGVSVGLVALAIAGVFAYKKGYCPTKRQAPETAPLL